MYECEADPILFNTAIKNFHDVQSVNYLFYLSYIRGECQNASLAYVAPSAERTYKYMLAYSIVSSIWIPTIILLLVGTCLGARGVKAKWIYSPYIIVTIVCCVLDVVATAFYAIDITKTLSVPDYIQFLNMPDDAKNVLLPINGSEGSVLAGLSMLPAIIMTIVVSRCVILWVLNVIFVAFGLQGLCAFKKPEKPVPYHQSPQYITDQQNQQGKQLDGGWIAFTKPNNTYQSSAVNNQSLYPNLHDPHTYDSLPREQMSQADSSLGRINPAYVIDEPMRLDPVLVEVKQERANLMREERYAEVAEIEMEPTPKELRHEPPKIEEIKEEQAKTDNILRAFSHVSVAESVLEDKDDVLEDVESVPARTSPAPSTAASHDDSVTPNGTTPRRVYDVHGNPTEERLTPKIARIQKIIEKQMAARQGDLSGLNNNKPYSYVQPLQPQLDSLPKKNDTVRGLEKPPIPVPDYSVRINKAPSFRAPLHNAD